MIGVTGGLWLGAATWNFWYERDISQRSAVWLPGEIGMAWSVLLVLGTLAALYLLVLWWELRTPRLPAPAAAPSAPAKPRPAARPRLLVRDTLNAIATPSAASGQGVLSVQAEPFGEVYLDGRHHGTAPREFQLPAGRYLVRVAHPQLGRRERRVEVRPGERARWVADFLGR
jgi:hypothetical protein